jgi:hypothetical protein
MHHQDCENNWLTEEPVFYPHQALLFTNLHNSTEQPLKRRAAFKSCKERQKRENIVIVLKGE